MARNTCITTLTNPCLYFNKTIEDKVFYQRYHQSPVFHLKRLFDHQKPSFPLKIPSDPIARKYPEIAKIGKAD